MDSDFIKVFVGIRRCGKTSLFHSWTEELQNKGIKKENIIFISLESSKYNKIINYTDLDELIYEKTKNIKGRIYLFFDEIQQVKEWEKSINGFRVSLDCDIYISSSNSKLLSGKLATLLAGIYITLNIYPFSFKEILKYKNKIEGIKLTNETIKIIFDEYYLNYGGMPSILSLKSDESRNNALKYIQVNYTLSSEETVKREFKPFFKIPNKYDTYIITTDQYDFSNKGVKHLNIIDFLLSDEI